MNFENHEDDVKLAMKFVSVVRILKIILAIIVVVVYFFPLFYPLNKISSLFPEIIVIALVITLLCPYGFIHIFLQKLLEYNTSTLEKRQILNAEETNKHFKRMDEKLQVIERKLERLSEKS